MNDGLASGGGLDGLGAFADRGVELVELGGLGVQAPAQERERLVGDHDALVRLQCAHVVGTADEPHRDRGDGDDAECDDSTVADARGDGAGQPGGHDGCKRHGHRQEHRVNHP